MKYRTHGTCSREIEVELEDGIIKSVKFFGGCNGNLSGITKLTVGMKAEDVIAKLSGVTCGMKNTSCPDQYARALKKALDEQNQ